MTDQEYLDLFRVGDGKFLIGIYQDGITVYKQQIRALNIFHSLISTGVIDIAKKTKISIIGGGVAGLTFAAAALKCNLSVRIFESEPNFLHMQHGCDTRKIHPNIYEWPEQGSLFPNAKLPVLGWTYDTASNVAKQILKGFEQIKQLIDSSDNYKAKNLYNEYLNCKISKVIENKNAQVEGKERFQIKHVYNKKNLDHYCDLIIYAVGYGVEIDEYDSNTPSYWRNDALGQSILNKGKRFLISGMGDGALMDLFRLKIRDFNYDNFLDIMKSDPKNYSSLTQKLIEIKKGGAVSKKPDYYMDAFKHQLEESFYAYILEALENKKLIRSNTVFLHSRRTELECMDCTKISLMNAFLAYILIVSEHCQLKNGKLEKAAASYTVNGKSLGKIDHVIIRYGTDKAKVIKGLKLSSQENKRIKKLQELQKDNLNGSAVERRWTFGEINSYFDRSVGGVDTILHNTRRREYLTPDTTSICLSHMNILAKTLASLSSERFRLCFNRVIQLDGEFFYQQITPYCNTDGVIDNGSVRSVYPIDQGSIGLSILSGRPIITLQDDRDAFCSLLKEVKIEKQYEQSGDSKAFLTLPILGQYKNPAHPKSAYLATNLILFVEATDIELLKNESTISMIYHSTKGFIDYLNHMVSGGQIMMSELEFVPNKLDTKKFTELSKNVCMKTNEFLSPLYENNQTMLKFIEFHSFDIIYNK